MKCDPVLDLFGPKMGHPSEYFAAARTCCASRFATLQLEHECQLIPFLFVRPKSGCYCQGSLSQPCFDHFLGPVLGHDEAGLLAFEAFQGSPRPARGTRTKRGSRGLESIYYGVRPSVTAKLPVLGPWFWNLILLNLAATSCYLHGKVLAAAGSESFMVEKSIAGSGARAEPLQAAAQSVATGISTVLLCLADAIHHCFLMLAS